MWDETPDNIDIGGGWSPVGPQSDGTYGVPATAGTPQPVDAGGGLPGNYSQTVLDVFKYGVGAWSQYATTQQQLDYRRWEATNVGPAQQGKPAYTVGVTAGGSGTMLILTAAAALALVLVLKR